MMQLGNFYVFCLKGSQGQAHVAVLVEYYARLFCVSGPILAVVVETVHVAV